MEPGGFKGWTNHPVRLEIPSTGGGAWHPGLPKNKSMAYRLKKHGLSNMEIARQLGCTDGLIVYMFQGNIIGGRPRCGYSTPRQTHHR